MPSKKILSLAISLSTLLSSCDNTLEREEYISWVRDYENGLHVRKAAGDFDFDIQYQPAFYLALLNNDTSYVSNQGIDHYILKVGVSDEDSDIINYGVKSNEELQRRSYYFSYVFQNDIYVLEGGKKLPCVLYHFEPSDMTNDRTIVIGFEKNEGVGSVDESIVVIESPFFSALPIKIKVSKKRIPAVKV